MIINFTIKNYRSFKEASTLSMEAEGSYRREGVALFDALSDRKILPAAGIFGPNGGGKSNVLRGLFYFKWAVNNSDQTNQPITAHPDLQPFLLDGNTDPIFFEIELFSQSHNREYTFGFSVLREKIIDEWFEVLDRPEKNRCSNTIYERKGRKIIFPKSDFRSELSKYNDVLSLDEGILTINRLANLVQFKYAREFLEEMQKIIIVIENGSTVANLAQLYQDKELAKQAFDIMRESDLCIKDLRVEEQNVPEALRNQIIHGNELPSAVKEALLSNPAALKSYNIKSLHRDYSSKGGTCEFDFMNNESSGTHKMLFYAQMMAAALKRGFTVVVDELGQGLHPFLSGKIVQTFLDRDSNTNGAQLIFDSHETFLLSRVVNMQNDQIYLTDKDSAERSSLTSLAEFEERNDAATVKRYLDGRLGGVPNLTDGGFVFNG